MFPGKGSQGEGPRSGLVKDNAYIQSIWPLTQNTLKAGPQYPQRSSVARMTLSCLPVVGISPPRDRIKENIPKSSESWEVDGIGCAETT